MALQELLPHLQEPVILMEPLELLQLELVIPMALPKPQLLELVILMALLKPPQ